MQHGSISINEINKSDGFILSAGYYLTLKPTIREFLKERAKPYKINLDWVDGLDYQSAKVLYEICSNYSKFQKALSQFKENIK